MIKSEKKIKKKEYIDQHYFSNSWPELIDPKHHTWKNCKTQFIVNRMLKNKIGKNQLQKKTKINLKSSNKKNEDGNQIKIKLQGKKKFWWKG